MQMEILNPETKSVQIRLPMTEFLTLYLACIESQGTDKCIQILKAKMSEFLGEHI